MEEALNASARAQQRLAEREQGAIAGIFRDAETLAARGLDPGAVRMEHAPSPGDNLVFDGTGWFVHMHLAPYGNGLLFELQVADGAILGIARPMAERFPIGTWRASVFVELDELVAAGAVAPDVVASIVAAAGSLVAEPRTRERLEARLASPGPAFEKLVAAAVEPGGGPRTLATVNFDSPLARRFGCSVRTEIEGAAYRALLPPEKGPDAIGLAEVALQVGADGRAIATRLVETAPERIAALDDPPSARPCRLTLGAGLFGQATLCDVAWAVPADAVRGPLDRALGTAEANAFLLRVEAISRGRDVEGRRVHQLVPAPSGAVGAVPLAALAQEGADVWLAAAFNKAGQK